MRRRLTEKQVYEAFAQRARAKRALLRRWRRQGFTSGAAYDHLRMNAASNQRCANQARALLWRARLAQIKALLPFRRRETSRTSRRGESELPKDVGPAARPGPTETCCVCGRAFPANRGHVNEISLCPACLDGEAAEFR
jgi:hypothetical protein